MKNQTKHTRFLLFVFSGLALLFFGLLFNIPQYLNLETLKRIIEPTGVFAPLVFIAIQTLVIAVLLPGSPITIAGGILFNPFWGIIYSVAASALGGSVLFLAARSFGSHFFRDWLLSRNKKYYEYLKKSESRGFALTLLLRAVAVIPFHALSILLGLSHVRFRDFFFATVLGVLPSTAVFVFFGNSILTANARIFSATGSILIIVWLAMVGLGAHYKHKIG